MFSGHKGNVKRMQLYSCFSRERKHRQRGNDMIKNQKGKTMQQKTYRQTSFRSIKHIIGKLVIVLEVFPLRNKQESKPSKHKLALHRWQTTLQTSRRKYFFPTHYGKCLFLRHNATSIFSLSYLPTSKSLKFKNGANKLRKEFKGIRPPRQDERKIMVEMKGR